MNIYFLIQYIFYRNESSAIANILHSKKVSKNKTYDVSVSDVWLDAGSDAGPKIDNFVVCYCYSLISSEVSSLRRVPLVFSLYFFCHPIASFISTVDTAQPEIIWCPRNIHKTIEFGETPFIRVAWEEPEVSDKSGNVVLREVTHRSGELFGLGSTPISYTYTDGSNNDVKCEFEVHISQCK